MEEVKKGLKDWLTIIALWIGFGGITAYSSIPLLGKDHELVGIVNMALPMLCFVAFSIFAQFASLLVIIYYLLTLPLRLFRRKKKTQSSEDKENVFPIGRLVILISIITYGMAGLFFRSFYGGEYWIVTYLAMGLCWGIILYVCLQRGVIDIEDMV